MRLQLEHCLLYAVTDRAWLRGQTLAQQVEAALRGGATMVQLREKELSGEALEQEAREILALCRRFGVPLLINDDVLLAARIGADGVHVGQSDMAAEQARALLGPDAIIGVTARTVEQAQAAEAAGADYLGSGAVFGTSTKKDAKPMDPAYFREICSSVSIPVVAIGGITGENIRQLSGHGMCGFAIVSGIFAADNIEARTRELWQAAYALCLPEAARRVRAMIEKKRPVVQCITNIVTVNDCANALLAAGASPTMAHHPAEMEDFAGVTDALVCNMGATESLEAMTAAGLASPEPVSPEPASSKAACPKAVRGRSAKELQETRTTAGPAAGTRSRPIVIDPVGCASSGFRREKCLELIYAVHPACIRGNAAEIRALATDHNTARGVDDIPDAADGTDGITGKQPARGFAPASEAARYAVRLAGQTGAVIVASGETDYVTDGTRLYAIRGGTKWMTRVTGTGCMLSALMGAYLAVEKTALGAAACCLHMNQCAEQAIQKTIREEGGTGTFHIRLIDAISGPVTAD